MINDMMKNMKIGMRTLLISMVALIGFIAIGMVTFWSNFTQVQNSELQAGAADELSLAKDVSEGFLNARRREKDFLLRLDESYIGKHAGVVKSVQADLAQLALSSPRDDQIQTIAQDFAAYEAQFGVVAAAWLKMGVNEESGLRGELRAAVQLAEELIKQHASSDLMVKLLMMRRHEKDFIIRLNEKYIGRLNDRVSEFKTILADKPLAPGIKTEILAALDTYQATFQLFASERLAIENEVSTLSQLFASADPKLVTLRGEIEAGYIDTTAKLEAANSLSFYITLGLILIIAIVCVALGYVVGRSISGPITSLAAAMGRLADGDKSVEIDTDGKDEVAQMAAAVQVFKENMVRNEQLQAEADAKQQAELARGKVISDLTNGFDGEAKELLADLLKASTELQTMSKDMTGMADDSGKRATAVAAATEETTSNVQMVATATTELSAAISEISSQVSNASAVAQETVGQANETSTVIDELSQTVSRIGEIIVLIQDVAEQTNLLALNATIESARAGEAGKGFAVVASEVKTLAGQTGKATEEIAAQIGDIQQRTEGAVQSIRKIVDKVSELGDITTAIAAGVEEQDAATKEISRNIENVSVAAGEVGQNVSHVSDSATKTGQMASEVLDASGQVNQRSNTLGEQVRAFLENVRAA